MITFSTKTTIKLVLILGCFSGLASADEKGLEISEEAKSRDAGWQSMVATVAMVLKDKRGKENKREFRLKYLEVPSDGDKSVVVFDQPRDIRGTSLLTWSHALEPDQQWLFLPAVKRVKRISSTSKSGSFVASEFAYEDIGSPEVKKYEHTYVREEQCAELMCFVLERTPRYKGSGYSSLLVWVDQENYLTHKIEYFDRKGDLLKTLQNLEYQQYNGRFWRAHKMIMTNHQSGKSTILDWDDIELGVALQKRAFAKAALQNTR